MHDWKKYGLAHNCSQYEISDNEIRLFSKPKQDSFNLPNLHVAKNMPTFLMPIKNDFTLTARCMHNGKSKFDASGLCASNDNMIFKFGVENFSTEIMRIVSVKTLEYSDEAIGSKINVCDKVLILTRNKEIISCYLSESKNNILFQRAFYVKEEMEELNIGFFVQSPFSKNGNIATFSDISLSSNPIKHIR